MGGIWQRKSREGQGRDAMDRNVKSNVGWRKEEHKERNEIR